jgi:prefoldin subunit 5
MSNIRQSQEQLIEELASLRQEVAELRTTKTAFDAQNELLKKLNNNDANSERNADA